MVNRSRERNSRSVWKKLNAIHQRILNAKNVERNLSKFKNRNLLTYLLSHPMPEMLTGTQLYFKNTNGIYKSTIRNGRPSANRKLFLENIKMLKNYYY